MKIIKNIIIIIAIIFSFAGCNRAVSESKISGEVNYNGALLGGATIEIYLKNEKDKSIPPFMASESDEFGRYELTIPPGKYFIIGKKRFMESGITKMLMSEHPKNPIVVKSGESLKVSPFTLFNMGEDKPMAIAGAGIIGAVASDAGDVAGAFIYVYPSSNPNMIGPSYIVSEEVGGDGSFKINLLPGSYYIAVRQREGKTKLGYLKQGDFAVDYKGNPVIVSEKEYSSLGTLTLHALNEAKLESIKKDEAEIKKSVKVVGRVTDEDGEPVTGMYVYAYTDPKMVGKPEAISQKTDGNGNYSLYIHHNEGSAEKKYFIGARTNFGGPLEPGEYVGTYNANPEHALKIGAQKEFLGVDISVKEVW